MATELHGTWPEALHRLGQLQWRRLRSHGAVYGVYGAALRALRMGRGWQRAKMLLEDRCGDGRVAEEWAIRNMDNM
jgi:hypothetical protein